MGTQYGYYLDEFSILRLEERYDYSLLLKVLSTEGMMAKDVATFAFNEKPGMFKKIVKSTPDLGVIEGQLKIGPNNYDFAGKWLESVSINSKTIWVAQTLI